MDNQKVPEKAKDCNTRPAASASTVTSAQSSYLDMLTNSYAASSNAALLQQMASMSQLYSNPYAMPYSSMPYGYAMPGFPSGAFWPGAAMLPPEYLMQAAALQMAGYGLMQPSALGPPTPPDSSFAEMLKRLPSAANRPSLSPKSSPTIGRPVVGGAPNVALIPSSTPVYESHCKPSPAHSIRSPAIHNTSGHSDLETLAEVATALSTGSRMGTPSSYVSGVHPDRKSSSGPSPSLQTFSIKNLTANATLEEQQRTTVDIVAGLPCKPGSSKHSSPLVSPALSHETSLSRSSSALAATTADTPKPDAPAATASADSFRVNPLLLSQSAMAWAALSNPWLFSSPLVSFPTPALNRNAGSGRSGTIRGRPPVISGIDGTSGRRKRSISGTSSATSDLNTDPIGDHLDDTIAQVIKQQQKQAHLSPQRRSSGARGRGRGSRGGRSSATASKAPLTVREQLALKHHHIDQGAAHLKATMSAVVDSVAGGATVDLSAPQNTAAVSCDNGQKRNVSMVSNGGDAMLPLDLTKKCGESTADVLSSAKHIKLEVVTNTSSPTASDHSPPRKPPFTDNYEEGDSSRKKKRRVADEMLCQIPLTLGWRRETLIRSLSASGVRGDVAYYAPPPSGKRLASHPDVLRYLERYKNEIAGLTRENFSFSSRLLVGDFLEVCSSKNGLERLSVDDIKRKIQSLQGQSVHASNITGDDAKGAAVEKKHQSAGNALATVGSEPMQDANHTASSSKRPCLSATRIASTKLVREAHKQRWWMKRLDRERQSRQDRRSEAVRRSRQYFGLAALRKQEEEYMKHFMLVARWEQERRQQQHVLTKALEAHHKQEERQRALAEKVIRREERIAARNEQLIMLRQQRQPCEDLEISEEKSLPVLTKVDHLKLPDTAFADVLMVLEFVNNFAHVLKIEKHDIPTVGDVQLGMLNDAASVPALVRLARILLTLCLEYPSLPAGPHGKTFLGQVARDMDVNADNLSELLRMFLMTRDTTAQKLGSRLEEHCFLALPATDKAAILAFLCNELLYCRNVVREIESNIDVVAKLKSDKWSLEGKIRQLKNLQLRKMMEQQANSSKGRDRRVDHKLSQLPVAEDHLVSSSGCATPGTRSSTPRSENADHAVAFDSDVLLDSSTVSVKDLDGRISQINEQVKSLRLEISDTAERVRVQPYGQDRYMRTYWALAHTSGMLVESMQSGGLFDGKPKNTCDGLQHLADDVQSIDTDVAHCVQRLLDAVCCLASSDELSGETGDHSMTPLDLTKSSPTTEALLCSPGSNSGTRSRRRPKPVPAELQHGWWHIGSLQELDAVQQSLQVRGIRERSFNRLISKHRDHIAERVFSSERGETLDLSPSNVKIANAVCHDKQADYHALMKVVRSVRKLEKQVLQANVNCKDWRPPDHSLTAATLSPCTANGCSDSDSETDDEQPLAAAIVHSRRIPDWSESHCLALLTEAKGRLLDLEQHLERRYLGPNFFNRELPVGILGTNSSALDAETGEEVDDVDQNDTPPPQLERWRQGVMMAKNASQFAMCVQELDRNIAWERSIMKAFCQLCQGGENDSQLLLCDGCDRGYHTYCFKPKLEVIPEGDWYCPQCISKASPSAPCCLLCRCQQDATAAPMLNCEKCACAFHHACLAVLYPGAKPTADSYATPNRKRSAASTWMCFKCRPPPVPTLCKKRSASAANLDSRRSSSGSASPATVRKQSQSSRKHKSTEMADVVKSVSVDGAGASSSIPAEKLEEICSTVVTELGTHADGWPFRLPVDLKAFPLYAQVIKHPMALSTVEAKLKEHRYDTEQHFLHDIRLIFSNCKAFNEDDSPVAKAGHSLKKYFNKRWKELKHAV